MKMGNKILPLFVNQTCGFTGIYRPVLGLVLVALFFSIHRIQLTAFLTASSSHRFKQARRPHRQSSTKLAMVFVVALDGQIVSFMPFPHAIFVT